MSRRSVLVAWGGLIVTSLVFTVAFIVLIRQQPACFAQAPLPDTHEGIKQRSDEFSSKFTELISAISSGPEWEEQFSDEQINSYLEENSVQLGIDRRLLPAGISEPRVVFDQDTIRLAFRYGNRSWSAIISIDFKVWLPKCEPNVVALELRG
ncbi:MAG: hypothetical protein ACRD36_03075, partial [Candidatus Acidiferrum sp.]